MIVTGKKCKIFVTGGSGFIGNSLVNRLLARGHELVCLAVHDDPRISYLEKPGVTLKAMSFLEKMYRIKGFLTQKRQVFNKEVIANFAFNSTVTCNKAFRELGFKPVALETRMKETIQWYLAQFQRKIVNKTKM